MAAWALILMGDLALEALIWGGFNWSISCFILNLGLVGIPYLHFVYVHSVLANVYIPGCVAIFDLLML
jgi:hypothetical protein